MVDKQFSREDFYDARELGAILKIDPQRIRSQVDSDPQSFGVPYIKVGRTFLFPKKAFEKFCNGGADNECE